VAAVTFAVPGNLDQPTGGYVYDRHVIGALRALGCDVDVIDLGDGFPRPSPAVAAAALPALRQVPTERPIVVDGLALGVLPEAAAALRATHRVIALVHHPLALESGIAPADAAAFTQSERAALAAVRHVIVTSPATARGLVADFAVPQSAITVAQPGFTRAPFVRRPADDTVNLLAVGSVIPRKGYDILIEALERLSDLDWRLVIAGDCTRDRDTAADVATMLVRKRFGRRVRMIGAVSETELSGLYDTADIFVLASRFEGYGMAYAEAIAHGLPVVGTMAGAIAETVPAGAGILVPPDNVPAFADALRVMIADDDLRGRCADVARNAVLPTWDDAAQAFLHVLETLP
jgi:glycosyltransferase involved in cell wall biosynthesis